MLKYFFISIIIIHGLIHFMGFSKAFGFGHLNQLTREISKPEGLLWLITGIIFILSLMFYLFKKEYWPYLAIIAVLFSQILIFNNWQDAKFGTIANVIILIIATIGIFQIQFKIKYKKEVQLGLEQCRYLPNSTLNEVDMVHLPNLIKKYLRFTGCIGKPKVNNFKIDFTGKIRDHSKPVWMKLSSEQYNFMKSPTRLFYLDAIMNQLPVSGFHCFKNGTAFMDIRLLSIFKVQYQKGPEMDVSETVTFFNDMCCMAPAALIDKRINWLEVENNKLKASFTNNGITISAWLYFNEKGELVNFISDDRYAANKNGTMIKTKWSTPLRDYKTINGYKLATYAEAIYGYPDGDFTYATFNLKDVNYNLLK